MLEYLWKLGLKAFCFVCVFLGLYLASFLAGLSIIGLFHLDESHVVKYLAYGSTVASILSFLFTALVHAIYHYFSKVKNFAPWFRAVNLLFSYYFGLMTVIAAMKGYLTENNLVTGSESIFDDQFSLMAIIFFVGLFNYSAYNSIVLTEPREIPILDWLSEMRYRMKEALRRNFWSR